MRWVGHAFSGFLMVFVRVFLLLCKLGRVSQIGKWLGVCLLCGFLEALCILQKGVGPLCF